MVSGLARRLAIAQATMLTSSSGVVATKNRASLMPARSSTSSLVPLPTMNSDVDVGEGVGDRAIVIDDDHFVIRRQRPRQGRADLPAADDYDAHRGMVGINVADLGAEPRLSG